MANRQISIIIPNHNQEETLAACIDSIFDTVKYPHWELIVVDDGSTDESLTILAKYKKKIRLIQQERNGAAAALNVGFKAAGKNDIVRVHADVTMETAGWLEKLVKAADDTPEAGVFGVRLIRANDTVQSIGRNILTRVGFREWHANLGIYATDKPGSSQLKEVDTVPGAAAFYRRETIDAVGGLDENYFPAWVEDDDFCLAARYRGFKVFVLPEIKAVHHSMFIPPIVTPFFSDTSLHLARLQHLKNEALERHYAYWEKKWGWNPMHPDLSEVRRLYGHTEICWRIGDPMRYQKTGRGKPGVDACMITWNSLPLLKRALESIAKTQYPKSKLKVYVVNNASTDGTKEYLEELVKSYPFKLIVIHLDVNVGAPPALNWAFIQGKGEIVAKLDDDIILPPDWLNLVDNFATRPFAGVVGAKVINDNTTHDIQVGGTSMWPEYNAHQSEIDHGQAEYLSLCTHVRGCACLYRRDVMQDCGLLDIRFSPSQTDDVEHHFRINAAGYEIVYNGKIELIHSLGAGAGAIRNRKAWSNVQANEHKLRGKWSEDIHKILEQNIDFSREGRFLPDDGDTSVWLSQGPQPGDYPKMDISTTNRSQLRANIENIESRHLPQTKKLLTDLVKDHVAASIPLIQQRRFEFGALVLHQAVILLPSSASAMITLAAIQIAEGKPERATSLLQRAMRFLPPNTAIYKALMQQAGLKPQNYDAQTLLEIAHSLTIYGHDRKVTQRGKNDKKGLTPSKKRRQKKQIPLNILIVGRYGKRSYDDPEIANLQSLIEKLRTTGATVKFSQKTRPDTSDMDLVHVWGSEYPEETLQQVKAVRVADPEIPIVLSPRYINIAETEWVKRTIPRMFSTAQNEDHLSTLLQQLNRDEMQVGGKKRSDRHNLRFPDFDVYQKMILDLVDYLLPQSRKELDSLGAAFPQNLAFSLLPYAFELASGAQTKPDLFIHEYGIRDFILMHGEVSVQENQIMALKALTNKPLVILGPAYQDITEYKRLCRKYASDNVLFIESLSDEMIASAYHAAHVFLSPCWQETNLHNAMQAAFSDCTLVMSNRTPAAEYFGNTIYSCDPADTHSISSAVTEALSSFSADSSRRERLKNHISQHFYWKIAADAALAAYKEVFIRKGREAPDTLTNLKTSTSLPLLASTPQIMHPSVQSQQPSVDIVIPIYGQAQLLKQCVDSVLRTTSTARLILVDDCSPGDEIQELFRTWDTNSRITLTKTAANQGFIGACLTGADLVTADYILFLNSDTEAIETDWLDKLIPEDDSIGVVGAALLYPPDQPGPLAGTIQHVGVARNSDGIPYHPSLGWPADHPEINQPRDVNAVTGACFLVRKKLWEELGGWDTRFGRGVYEDVDFCWRTRKLGYRVVVQSKVRLYHHESASKSPDGNHSLNEHMRENLKMLMEKWQPLTSDEGQFFGSETITSWERIRPRLKTTLQLIQANQLPDSGEEELQRIVDQAPDLPEALAAYANALAKQGKHSEAAEYYKRTLRLAPARWETRLQLVDQLILSNQQPQAAYELEQLKAVFPKHPEIMRRTDSLSSITPRPYPEAPTGDSAAALLTSILEADDIAMAVINHEDRLNGELIALVRQNADTARAENNHQLAEGLDSLAVMITQTLEERKSSSISPSNQAAATLKQLLNAEDLSSALIHHEHQLNPDLLSLVRQNAAAAQAENNPELADGLNTLAAYIQQVIDRHRPPSTAATNHTAETLNLLLEADDLLSALKQNENSLDHDLYDLVCLNANTARTAGNLELANGLNNLAEYIQQIIAAR